MFDPAVEPSADYLDLEEGVLLVFMDQQGEQFAFGAGNITGEDRCTKRIYANMP
jgi:hypothetical protein